MSAFRVGRTQNKETNLKKSNKNIFLSKLIVNNRKSRSKSSKIQVQILNASNLLKLQNSANIVRSTTKMSSNDRFERFKTRIARSSNRVKLFSEVFNAAIKLIELPDSSWKLNWNSFLKDFQFYILTEHSVQRTVLTSTRDVRRVTNSKLLSLFSRPQIQMFPNLMQTSLEFSQRRSLVKSAQWSSKFSNARAQYISKIFIRKPFGKLITSATNCPNGTFKGSWWNPSV